MAIERFLESLDSYQPLVVTEPKFITSYSEKKDALNRGDKFPLENGSCLAVLDGQQRITSIYLGVAGTFLLHKKGAPWKEDSSFVEKRLCIDLLNTESGEDADNNLISLDFIEKPLQNILPEDSKGRHYWLPFSTILSESWKSAACLAININTQYGIKYGDPLPPGDLELVSDLAGKAETMVLKSSCISYFSADKDLWDVVETFVRVNSGGQVLKTSDLMLSIASASQNEDVQLSIHEAISDIYNAAKNTEKAFEADTDLILRANLMFLSTTTSLSLKDKRNWTRETISNIMDVWDDTKKYLIEAVRYIEAVGFDPRKLTSSNIVLPVAYFFYKHQIEKGAKYADDTKASARANRSLITQWMLRVMIKGVFGYGTPVTLMTIKRVIDESFNENEKTFPLAKLMDPNGKKSLRITEDDIDDMLRYKYGDVRVYPLLGAISNCDPYHHTYHVDHMWPQASFTSKRTLRRRLKEFGLESKTDKYYSSHTTLSNLELLRDSENSEKGDADFDQWIAASYPEEEMLDEYCKRCLVPRDTSLYSFEKFLDLRERREELLRKALKEAFPDDAAEKIEKEAFPNA